MKTSSKSREECVYPTVTVARCSLVAFWVKPVTSAKMATDVVDGVVVRVIDEVRESWHISETVKWRNDR